MPDVRIGQQEITRSLLPAAHALCTDEALQCAQGSIRWKANDLISKLTLDEFGPIKPRRHAGRAISENPCQPIGPSLGPTPTTFHLQTALILQCVLTPFRLQTSGGLRWNVSKYLRRRGLKISDRVAWPLLPYAMVAKTKENQAEVERYS